MVVCRRPWPTPCASKFQRVDQTLTREVTPQSAKGSPSAITVQFAPPSFSCIYTFFGWKTGVHQPGAGRRLLRQLLPYYALGFFFSTWLTRSNNLRLKP